MLYEDHTLDNVSVCCMKVIVWILDQCAMKVSLWIMDQ